MNERFCDKPFTEITVNELDNKVCCYMGKGSIPKVDPISVWNHQVTRNIRRTILDGSFDYCRCCPLYRAGVNDERCSNYNTGMLAGPKHIALSNDTSCNLSCPSCKVSLARPTSFYGALSEQLGYINSFQSTLKSIELTTRGDPFGSRSYRALLQLLREPFEPKIRLHTNGLLLPRFWDSMPVLHRKDGIGFMLQSIDAATEGTYEENRRGGTWRGLLESLAFIRELRFRGHKFPWYITMVTQANNWREIPEFIKLGEVYGVDFINITWLINLTFTNDEYLRRAVHIPGHPDHQGLLDMLENIKAGLVRGECESSHKECWCADSGPVIEVRKMDTAQPMRM